MFSLPPSRVLPRSLSSRAIELLAYDHDGLGRLVAMRENGTIQVAGFGYDSAGRPQSKTFAGASETYAYAAVSRLQSLSHDLGGTASDDGLTFAYNPASQIVSRTRTNDSYAAATPAAESRSYAVNGLNQYMAVAGAAHAYDPNGNLTSDGSTAYLYDTENRLVSAGGARTAGLSYDPLGRLHQTWGGAAGTTWFLYDGDELVAEYNGATMLRRYVHGIGVDDPVVWYEGGTLGQRRSLMADHQGSIVAVADSAGNKLAINAYDSWGVPNPGNSGRFQYTGQAWVPELSMYHYKARVYSPGLGRFLQTDPVGYDDDTNLYAYGANDPLNKTDPTGLCGDRYKDGSCRVRYEKKTGAAGYRAARALERRLNVYDKAVNSLADDAEITIRNRDGEQTGTISGGEYKSIWNKTSFKIVSGVTDNGGAGGATGGTWLNGSFQGGRSRLTPGVVSDYAARGVKFRGKGNVGIDTLMFHELSHNTLYGKAQTKLHPAHGGPFHPADWTREHRSSNAGNAMAEAVGGTYSCEATGCD